MMQQVLNLKITVLISIVLFLFCGVVGISYADENTGSPHFHGETTTRSVTENVATGTNIRHPVSAHDFVDTNHRYVLRGTDAASFAIDGSTGQLRTNTVLDYETKSSYSVMVVVQEDITNTPIDGDSISVTIKFWNVALRFSEGDSATRSVSENVAAGTNIGSPVSASFFNPDLDRYILSGTDASSFTIDASTGQLKTQAALDFYVKNSYSVTVEVYAGAQTSSEDSISVTIIYVYLMPIKSIQT